MVLTAKVTENTWPGLLRSISSCIRRPQDKALFITNAQQSRGGMSYFPNLKPDDCVGLLPTHVALTSYWHPNDSMVLLYDGRLPLLNTAITSVRLLEAVAKLDHLEIAVYGTADHISWKSKGVGFR